MNSSTLILLRNILYVNETIWKEINMSWRNLSYAITMQMSIILFEGMDGMDYTHA